MEPSNGRQIMRANGFSMLKSGAELRAEIDHCIRRTCHGTHRYQGEINASRARWVSLSAIGQCLEYGYDALMPPMPQPLIALVGQV